MNINLLIYSLILDFTFQNTFLHHIIFIFILFVLLLILYFFDIKKY